MPEKTRTSAARNDGLTLLLLGCAFFLLSGVVWTAIAPRALMDFRPAFLLPAACYNTASTTPS